MSAKYTQTSLSAVQRDAATRLLRTVISQVSPEEVVLVDYCFSQTDDNADGMLGFGVGPEFALLLPVIRDALIAFANTAMVELAKTWGKELVSTVTDKKDFKTIDADVLDTLGKDVVVRLERQGVPSSQALRAADCMIATMVSHPDLVARLARKG